MRQVVDVPDDTTPRREGHYAYTGRVAIDCEVGQELLNELQLGEEVLRPDAGRTVDEEHQLGLAIDRSSQVLYVSLQQLPEMFHLQFADLLNRLRVRSAFLRNPVAGVPLLPADEYAGVASSVRIVVASEQKRVEQLRNLCPRMHRRQRRG